MINPGKPFDIHDYIEILLRRIWYIIIPAVVIFIGAVLYVHYAPKEYRATTLILVTPQKVPEAFVRPTVTSTIGERLQSIGQEIMSRTRLEQIISELNLFQEEARSSSLEGIVELMRRNINVEIKGREGYFTISYIGKDPKIVTVVTNKLASLFIEENLKFRESQAQGTSEFLSVELQATKAKLEEQERTLTNFKRKFMGELPEQRDTNLRVLEQLQLQLQRIGENIRSAQDRKLLIQKQISDTEWLIASASSKQGENFSSTSISPILKDPKEMQLEQLRNNLADLQLKYTEKHPDVLMIKKKIVDLEAKIEKAKLEGEWGESKDSDLKQDRSTPIKETPLHSPKIEAKRESKGEKSESRLSPRYKEMETQLTAIEIEIERFKAEEARVKAQINRYQERIEVTPERELAMTQLTRNYQTIKDTYQSLLKKSEEAKQAENLERRQKGEQFKVIDPARVPGTPFKPNIPKILLFGLLLGMGAGFGMAFFREQMDRSFRDAEDLEATFGLKVLANIPKIEGKIEKKAA